MFNSLIEVNRGALFPQTFNATAVSDALFAAFPALNVTCNGYGANVAYTIDKSGSPESQSITFDSAKGIVFGGRKNDVRSTIDVSCDGFEDTVYSFSSQIHTAANITMHNFVVYPAITE